MPSNSSSKAPALENECAHASVPPAPYLSTTASRADVAPVLTPAT